MEKPKPATMSDHEVMTFASAQAWRTWLERHHATTPGIWMRIAKKGAPETSISYATALDEALCFGWIDGLKNALDDVAWLQKFTPRRSKSMWSQVNRAKVAQLILADRMQPAGHREIDAAKADGRWDSAYAPQSSSVAPLDLVAELDRLPKAKAFYASLNSANRYAILHRLQTATKPELRARRLAKLVDMLKRGEQIHP